MRKHLLAMVWLLSPSVLNAAAPTDSAVRYDRDVRPILSDKCFTCHGPHDEQRQAKLRLDTREGALAAAESGRAAIVPGDISKSELLKRINSTDPDEVMPPPSTNKTLTAAEKQALQLWIAAGAEYRQHWSLVPAQRPQLPKVSNAAWPRTPIDHFILARLDAEKLNPAPEADRVTLIRRLSLDLVGLPPTPAEVDAFVGDDKSGAYERLVERLLASPRFGERMAIEWLDAARYADTHGYHIDSHRDMWPWRNWVIEAFNRNLPFDQFTVQQIAGDLLPDATMDQRVASGFNRNHMINFEGGAIPAEYHAAYIVDRVNTTGAVWLGLTIGCAQCHDHKYDPISQKEFYQLYAFFHNVPENPLDGRKGNAAPLVKLPTADQDRDLAQLEAETKALQARLGGKDAELDAAQTSWELEAAEEQAIDWVVLTPDELRASGDEATLTVLEDQSVLASGKNPAVDAYSIEVDCDLAGVTALRLEMLPDDSLPAHGPGRSSNGNVVLTSVKVTVHQPLEGDGDKVHKFKDSSADFSQKDFPVANAIDDKGDSGWAIYPQVGKPHWAVLEFAEPLPPGEKRLTIKLDFYSLFNQHQLGRFRLSVTTSTDPHAKQGLPANIQSLLTKADEERTKPQRDELRTYFRQQISPVGKRLKEELATLGKRQHDLEQQVPTAMIMQELPKPRDTFVMLRGQYDKLGDKVAAAVPASLPPLKTGAPANRLGLAEWLVSPTNPLTPRVIVNRYWQMYFGLGLVRTSEDFGSQGEYPSHPELLDWLASEFADGWDVKHLQRLIVCSAAYRQASRVSKELVARDPENRLLARGPRLRLPAELIRDQALAAGGLLDGRVGGPSVSPYQPPGLWEEMAFGREFTAQAYVQSHGADLYRRSMYTFWKRTVPPATMSTFDAPDREICTLRRARTNTPLQALILMNDPTYVEAARKLAERVLASGSSSVEERLTLAFRLVLARSPKAPELKALGRLLEQELATYQADSSAAEKLITVGESTRRSELSAAELAAWTAVASVLLNLDETVTKG